MARECLNHPGTPAQTMCFQCHKPICKACVILAQQGTFCSIECSLLKSSDTQRRKAAEQNPRRGRRLGLVGMAIIFILLIFGFLLIAHFFAEKEESLRKVDLLGKIIEAIRGLFYRQR